MTENFLKKFVKYIDKKIFFNFIKELYVIIYINFIKKNLFFLYANKNYNYKNFHYFNNSKNNLSSLCEKYGSDKGYLDFEKPTPFGWKSHSYSEIYFDLFNLKKDEIKLVFECGIGSNNPNMSNNMTVSGKPGASLRVWNDYFKNALIFGADIDKSILFSEGRIKTFHVDQLKKESIKSLWDNVNENNFDLIIMMVYTQQKQI